MKDWMTVLVALINGIATVLFCLIFLAYGCGSSSKEQQLKVPIRVAKETCQSKALDIIAADASCETTAENLEHLAHNEPSCVAILGGQNFGTFCRNQANDSGRPRDASDASE